ncbi:MAG: precorrin-6y C5,15-methyltransferase (decarboxylating) subunit CbiE [Leptospirales bacterium]|nr:precorrin-6y C5,15-methyltransferase (decarboxylating) subunit CbiE [Leptospirales bacterium]
MKTRAITIVGMGDDGCAGLNSIAIAAISSAQVLVGGERHLGFFPDFQGTKISLKTEISKALKEAAELANENNVCVLASGDPLFYGVGALLVKLVGAEHVRILPHPTSLQVAFARAAWRWDDANWISLHGKSRNNFLTRLKRIAKLGVLTDPENNPAAIARYMLDHSEISWEAWVCENLESEDEKVRHFSNLEDLASCTDVGPLNVLLLRRTDKNWRPLPQIVNQSEDLFAKRIPKQGLITKKEIRLLSIGELQVRRESVIWDIGAASGSIAIECALLADLGHAYAIEVDPESIAFCRDNIEHFGVDNVTVIEGRAPEVLSEIKDDPDCVFIGGSKGSLQAIIETSFNRLRPGGRLVVNAITFENIEEAYRTFRELKLEPGIMMINISRAVPLARFMRYEAQNPIHNFMVEKPFGVANEPG